MFFVFLGGSDSKASACSAGDLGLIPELGRSPGEGNGNPLQYSCLENFMDWGAWWATVYGVTRSRTRLSCFLVIQLCPTFCNPMDCSMPGFPVLHCLLEFAQTHVHWIWCHSTISSSVARFSSCLQSFSASGSFPMSWLFASGGQIIEASASVLLMNIQGWFPLGLTGLISLLSKGLSRVFSSTTVWMHQFFSAQSYLWSNSHICTWQLEKP